MIKIKIHRGTDMIGGSITEIYTENTHLFIDFGSELNPDPNKSTDSKMIEMINKSECDAVLFSHYHGDHIGLMGSIPETDIRGRKIMLGMGLEARKVLIRIHKTLSSDFGGSNNNAGEHIKLLELLKNRSRWIDFFNKQTFTLGDFTITTVRVDHSAFDAYMFIIQAEGKTIVHTGDYRTHGRMGERLFPDLKEVLDTVMDGKQPDILITEGTMLERTTEKVMTEVELETEAERILSLPENKYAFLLCSSTNVESLASFCNAAKSLDRPFIVNSYVFSQIKAYRKAAAKEKLEGFEFRKVYAFENMDTPNERLGGLTQPEYMKKHGFVMMVGTTDSYIPRMEYFRDGDPLLIYSMWHGYIDKKNHPDTYNEAYGKLYESWRHIGLHTSGHATVEDIEKMISVVGAKKIIPIHTTKKNDFEGLNTGNSAIEILNDGDVLEV